MEKRVIAVLGCVVLLVSLAAHAWAQEPLAFQAMSATVQPQADGGSQVTFVVVLNLNVVPIAFNYHWERSDGAKSGVQVRSVQPGTTSIPISTTWDLGPNAPVKEIWEKLFIDTGNTHLESEPVKFVIP